MGRSFADDEGDRINRLNYEETELRLGLPGAAPASTDSLLKITNGGAKRGFSQTVDLKLNLSSKDSPLAPPPNAGADHHRVLPSSAASDPAKPPAPKAQVVGWPPVRAFRKNILSVQNQKKSNEEVSDHQKSSSSAAPASASASVAAFVKVSMDGAPYLRKVDLKLYKSYQDLSDALSKMFCSFTIGNYCGGSQGTKDFMNETKLIDLLSGSDYVPTYEDRDGDWMLVGDVPWEMFVDSCKRLRIMKGSEAIGLAPRALEKCKNR